MSYESLNIIYPLVRFELDDNIVELILLSLVLFSGPEYLLLIGPRLNENVKILRALSIGNAITFIQVTIFFIGSVFFYSAGHMNIVNHIFMPMARYLQLPYIERIDIIILPLLMLYYIYVISLLVLYILKVIELKVKTVNKNHLLYLVIFLFIISIISLNKYGAKSHLEVYKDINYYLSIFSFCFIPLFFYITSKIKEGA